MSPRSVPRDDSYNNAFAEAINGLCKAKIIRKRGPWKNLDDVKLDDVKPATLEWVDWLDHSRLLEPIGHIPSAEPKEMFYREEVLAEEADSNKRVSTGARAVLLSQRPYLGLCHDKVSRFPHCLDDVVLYL